MITVSDTPAANSSLLCREDAAGLVLRAQPLAQRCRSVQREQGGLGDGRPTSEWAAWSAGSAGSRANIALAVGPRGFSLVRDLGNLQAAAHQS
jgi:hypothetical protein